MNKKVINPLIREMIFLRKISDKAWRYKKLLFCIWIAIFFILHNINAWGLLKKENAISFFYVLSLFGIFFGIVWSYFIIPFFMYRKDAVKLSVSVILPVVFFWLATLFFVNVDIITNFHADNITSIYFSSVDVTQSLLITVIFFISAYAFGKRILFFWKPSIFNKVEDALISLAIGIGFWSNLFFFLGILKLGYTWIAYSLMLVVIMIGRRDIKELFLSAFRKKIEISLKRTQLLETAAGMLLFGLFLVIIIYSLANLASAGWDTFHQYLTFPDVYQKNHGLVYFPFHPHWGFPQLCEMVFFCGMLLGGIKVPFLMNYFFIILGLAGFTQIAKRANEKLNIWPVAILASIPLILVFQSGYLKVESLLFFYLVMIFMVIRKILNNQNVKNLWI